ncbi:hypothetical protein GCM10023322_51990 [Rugosimonospora acidiphila]|uniref:Uncharacterized protein n=1 Tax=Rugosimonospora acidiphila TaxID=556531 RepID=A0ABP9S9U4_9ACTN
MADSARGWRSAHLAQTVERIERQVELAWARLREELDVAAGSPDEAALCWLVVDDPGGYDWRVVDAALDQLACPECGSVLTRGPADCGRCAYYHGVRFAAREVDRPAVPPGNEHAIRVAFAVARAGSRYPARARAGFELLLPTLVAGDLPTTPQAQAARALLNKLTPDECDRVVSFAEVERLAHGR